MNGLRNTALRLTLFACAFLCAGLADALAQDGRTEAKYEAVVTGTVRDRESGRKLDNVTVSLSGSAISTVTNADGYFSLKIPGGEEPVLDFSLIGYADFRFTATPAENGRYTANVRMSPLHAVLDEAIIYGEPRRLVEEALLKIPQNYPSSENLLSAFYRETVQKGRRYISVSEAILDIYKTAYYRRSSGRDVVQLAKARRLLSQKSSDTLGVKIAGGPTLALIADVVKDADILFDLSTLDLYHFTMQPGEMIGDRVQYVVGFTPRVRLDYALYSGKVYIDRDNLAFTRAEFSLDLTDTDKATAVILYRKPAGLHFRPQEVSFLVTYREQDGVTRLNYICSDLRFKCDWKKLTFSSSYVARSEMVVVDREDSPERVLDRKNSFRQSDVFYDMVEEYWNADYWRDYNIIEPTESLESAVKRLKRKMN